MMQDPESADEIELAVSVCQAGCIPIDQQFRRYPQLVPNRSQLRNRLNTNDVDVKALLADVQNRPPSTRSYIKDRLDLKIIQHPKQQR